MKFMTDGLQRTTTVVFFWGPVVTAFLIFSGFTILVDWSDDGWVTPFQLLAVLGGAAIVQAVFSAALGWRYFAKFELNKGRYLGVGSMRHVAWGAVIFFLSGIIAAVVISLVVSLGATLVTSGLTGHLQSGQMVGVAAFVFMVCCSYAGLTLLFAPFAGVLAAKFGNTAL